MRFLIYIYVYFFCIISITKKKTYNKSYCRSNFKNLCITLLQHNFNFITILLPENSYQRFIINILFQFHKK